jgi:hypothetical protein
VSQPEPSGAGRRPRDHDLPPLGPSYLGRGRRRSGQERPAGHTEPCRRPGLTDRDPLQIIVSSARSFGPAFRQWLGTGPGPVRQWAVVDDCGWVWWWSSWVVRPPVAWDHPWPCGGPEGIFSVGHLPGCRGFSGGRKGLPAGPSGASPCGPRRFWGRLCCLAGKMAPGLVFSSSLREGRGCGGSAAAISGFAAAGWPAGWLAFAGAGRTRRPGPARRRLTGAGRWPTVPAAGRPSGPATRAARGWRW